MQINKYDMARKQENFLLSKKETRDAFCNRIRFELNAQKPRSQWSRGVRCYGDLTEAAKFGDELAKLHGLGNVRIEAEIVRRKS